MNWAVIQSLSLMTRKPPPPSMIAKGSKDFYLLLLLLFSVKDKQAYTKFVSYFLLEAHKKEIESSRFKEHISPI